MHCAVYDRDSSAVAPLPQSSWGISTCTRWRSTAPAVEPGLGGGHAGPASKAQLQHHFRAAGRTEKRSFHKASAGNTGN